MKMKSDINKDLPIDLIHMQPLIDRVAEKYPYLKKYEIVIIIRTFFETLRYILVSGDKISLNGFFANMFLIHFSRTKNKKKYQVIKTKLSTPKKIRKWKNK
jgi:nucleoid DNA-binding protein